MIEDKFSDLGARDTSSMFDVSINQSTLLLNHLHNSSFWNLIRQLKNPIQVI